MGKDVYDAILGENKEIWKLDYSSHFEMWLDINKQYRYTVENFLTK